MISDYSFWTQPRLPIEVYQTQSDRAVEKLLCFALVPQNEPYLVTEDLGIAREVSLIGRLGHALIGSDPYKGRLNPDRSVEKFTQLIESIPPKEKESISFQLLCQTAALNFNRLNKAAYDSLPEDRRRDVRQISIEGISFPRQKYPCCPPW